MSLFSAVLPWYQRTLKRSPWLHRGLYALFTGTVVPVLQIARRFRTVSDDPLSFRLALLTGSHEDETVRFVERLVGPNMVILDIGAHVGYFTNKFSDLVGPSGKVFAFEPHPVNFALLERNTGRRRNVVRAQAAVSDRPGSAVLHDYLPLTAGSSLAFDAEEKEWFDDNLRHREIAPRLRDDETPEAFTVKTTSIDTVLQDASVERVDFVKVDIEGFEGHALRGMAATMERSPDLAIVMELKPRALQRAGTDPAELLAWLRRQGFALYVLEDGLEALDEQLEARYLASLLDSDKGEDVNLLCVKGERHAPLVAAHERRAAAGA